MPCFDYLDDFYQEFIKRVIHADYFNFLQPGESVAYIISRPSFTEVAHDTFLRKPCSPKVLLGSILFQSLRGLGKIREYVPLLQLPKFSIIYILNIQLMNRSI